LQNNRIQSPQENRCSQNEVLSVVRKKTVTEKEKTAVYFQEKKFLSQQ